MSARETHSCFGMEKNSTDLGICKTLWRKNWFLLESPVVSVDPSCHQDPLLVVQSESEQVLDAIATRFWKQLYVYSSYVFSFNMWYHWHFRTVILLPCMTFVKGERKCALIWDEWETGNVRLREEASHVSSTHFCSPPIKKLHCVGNLKPDLKLWKCFKILWKVKRFEEIYLL